MEKLNYIPKYVKQISDSKYGDVVTHERYDELLNLLSTQGDYNTEVLRTLLTPGSEGYHIDYLDKEIEKTNKAVTDLDEKTTKNLNDYKKEVTNAFTNIDNKFNTVNNTLAEHTTNISSINNDILNIINGVTKIKSAIEADKIKGIDEAGTRKYYGTNKTGTAGFHDMPASIFTSDMSESTAIINKLIFTPGPDSVAESMLTEAVRTKLNRTSITNYEQLDNIPKINDIELKGNKSLSELGIQPAGNYLTNIPEEYITETELDTALAPKMNTTDANNTFVTNTGLSTILNNYATNTDVSNTYATKDTVNNLSIAMNSYAKVYINNLPSNPNIGDLYITV